MKVLHVIHGFPPHYMAGSEVYTYNLVKEQAKTIDVSVFTRIENPFGRPYSIKEDKIDGVTILRVNKPLKEFLLRDKYADEHIDDIFRNFIRKEKPDVVHIGHLCHLSTNIVNIIKEEIGVPIVFTIHDFWLFCYRGQCFNIDSEVCKGPSKEHCMRCMKNSFKDVTDEDFNRYSKHMDKVRRNIDLYLSPSHILRDFYIKNGVSEEFIHYSRYGFNPDLIKYQSKQYRKDSKITFGFLGRIIPVKGIKVLLEAFKDIKGKHSRLKLYGSHEPYLQYLKEYANQRTDFMGGYHNNNLNLVLDGIDVLVVPSLWLENSPLVIQEAFLAGIPVITSNIGGMAELVEEGKDGYHFKVADKESLTNVMQSIVNNPTQLNDLRPDRGKVRTIKDDSSSAINQYRKLVN